MAKSPLKSQNEIFLGICVVKVKRAMRSKKCDNTDMFIKLTNLFFVIVHSPF